MNLADLQMEAEQVPLEWWVLAPSLVMLTFVVLLAPWWPWSRGWGWVPAGMGAVGLFVAALFTLAWVFS